MDNARKAADTIRVWTMQPWTVWEQVAAKGSLTVDPRYTANLHHCYDWLQEQLVSRIPGYVGHYPWWAYCKRPDLRRFRHGVSYGAREALIELELPRERSLTILFWAWDLIFRGQFLSGNRQESEAWHCRLRATVPADSDDWGESDAARKEPWLTELEASWERLFDRDLPERGWEIGDGPDMSERETVFEVLSLDCVRKVTPFVGTSKRAEPRTMTWDDADLEFFRGRAGGRTPRPANPFVAVGEVPTLDL